MPYALARTTEEGLDDPQVRANGMVETLIDPEVGPLAQMGVPVQLSRTPGRIQGPRALPDASSSDLPADTSTPAAALSAPLPETAFDLPLQGIRVLEITNLIAGPIAGRLLADLGADVIKVEPHAGDISRPLGRTYFFNVNVNKRSLCLNTREPEGKVVAQKVAATADVMLANLRPGATARMGLGPDDLRALNPRLIETHVTGFGATGPYAHRPGIDPLSQALMGLSRAQGGAENPPVFPAPTGAHRLHRRGDGHVWHHPGPVRPRTYRPGAACRYQPAQRRHHAHLRVVHALRGQTHASLGGQGPVRLDGVSPPVRGNGRLAVRGCGYAGRSACLVRSPGL